MLPVAIMSEGVVMRLMVPTPAVDFWFTGVPDFTANTISIRVGSSDQGRTAVTWPTLMPPNSTAAPGASPPAYRRCVVYGTCPRTVCVVCMKYAAEPRISRLAMTNTPTFASVVMSWTPANRKL